MKMKIATEAGKLQIKSLGQDCKMGDNYDKRLEMQAE